jgi:hypothetical protein
MLEGTGTILDALDTLGKAALREYRKSKDDVKKAFYMGMLNVCAGFCSADELTDDAYCATISLDFDEVKEDLEKALQKVEKPAKSEEKVEQPTLDKLYPEIFEEFDKRLDKIEKMFKKAKKE